MMQNNSAHVNIEEAECTDVFLTLGGWCSLQMSDVMSLSAGIAIRSRLDPQVDVKI